MRRMTILLILLIGTLTMASCNLANPGPDDCRGSGTLFQDDFSGERDCGWAVYNQGGAVAAVEEGILRISTSQAGKIWWSNPGQNFDDVIITVQARQVSGPNNNAYGVICRYQNEENFYVFLISGDGYYTIGKYQSGNDQVVYLTENAQYQPSDFINQGVATNQIRVSCVGNQLSLAVNGLPLFTTTDPTFVTGDVGLGVSTLEQGTAVVQFDNFSVIAP